MAEPSYQMTTAKSSAIDFNLAERQQDPPVQRDPREVFIEAVRSTVGGAPSPDTLIPGRMVRFATSDRRGDLSGWAKLFSDGEG